MEEERDYNDLSIEEVGRICGLVDHMISNGKFSFDETEQLQRLLKQVNDSLAADRAFAKNTRYPEKAQICINTQDYLRSLDLALNEAMANKETLTHEAQQSEGDETSSLFKEPAEPKPTQSNIKRYVGVAVVSGIIGGGGAATIAWKAGGGLETMLIAGIISAVGSAGFGAGVTKAADYLSDRISNYKAPTPGSHEE